MKFRGILVLWMGVMVLLPVGVGADALLFHSGHTRYGTVLIQDATSVVMEIEGRTETFLRKSIHQIYPGLVMPATGETTASDDGLLVHRPNEVVYSVTGEIAARRKMVNTEGREYWVDVERDFEVPRFQLKPAGYSFYNRRGSYLSGIVRNQTDQVWHATEFRVTFFDQTDQLIASKDFYIFHLPPKGQRVYHLALPDVPYDQIERIRMVRKF
ncbi:MAG: hypothetical protein RBU29_02260 [bacterium]|jgi:hypothetical protein|nr:hypothetical protein [bacterium]